MPIAKDLRTTEFTSPRLYDVPPVLNKRQTGSEPTQESERLSSIETSSNTGDKHTSLPKTQQRRASKVSPEKKKAKKLKPRQSFNDTLDNAFKKGANWIGQFVGHKTTKDEELRNNLINGGSFTDGFLAHMGANAAAAKNPGNGGLRVPGGFGRPRG